MYNIEKFQIKQQMAESVRLRIFIELLGLRAKGSMDQNVANSKVNSIDE